MEFAVQVAAFLVGVLRDGTAVDDANIGFGRGRDAHETAALELAGEGRGLRKIELAAQGMKIDSARLHGFVFFRHEITKTARKEEAFPIKKRKFARNYKEYMGFFSDLIQYGYLSNALAACVLSGITCGVIGTYVVCRRMVFLAGGITHASFGGLGIAFWMGANPIAGAMIFAVLSALGIEWAGSRGRIREDSAIGIIWSVGMAVGALFMSLRPGYTSGDLSAYLFGSIVTVTDSDVAALAALTAVIIAGALLWLRPVMYTAFDRDFARSRGIPTRVISYLMAALVAVTIVLSIRIMGIVLLISLVTMPVVIVNSLSRSYRTIALAAPLVAVAGNVAGLVVSYNFEVPPGAAIIFTLTLTLIMVKLLSLRQKRLPFG